ncbi:MAG: Fmu (Sun) domain-containing protein [Chitinophagaceae bacterium]|nr:Fmu (Sun) domain-containing protein [Chitinophagaceae bacterium]
MSRYHSYIKTAASVIEEYDGSVPLAAFLKTFFARSSKYGSRDRKSVSHLVYCFYRCGHALSSMTVEDKLLAAQWLCVTDNNSLLESLQPEWFAARLIPVLEKFKQLGEPDGISHIFPWRHELSEGIDPMEWGHSFLQQPDLFIRLRPGKQQKVKQQLKEAGIVFSEMHGDMIRLANNTPVDAIIQIGHDAIVQDFHSGQTLSLLRQHNVPDGLTAWDCCAGSGGKSILLTDLFPATQLTVTDIRKSILVNLGKRFTEAGVRAREIREADLVNQQPFPADSFQLIVADVPCSGSGTWGRTPEQLCFFKSEAIGQYADLQQKILSHAVPALQKGGWLLYITCSVFKKENEMQADWLQKKFPLQLLQREWFRGAGIGADSMFAALFRAL